MKRHITNKEFGKRLQRDVIKWELALRDLVITCRRDVNGRPTPRVQAAIDDGYAYLNRLNQLEHRWSLGEEPNSLNREWSDLRKTYGADRPQIAIGRWWLPLPHRDPTAVVIDSTTPYQRP